MDLLRRLILGLSLALMLCGAVFADPLELTAELRQEGQATVVYGKTNLPDGTKMLISLDKRGGWGIADYEVFVTKGRYESKAFTRKGKKLVGDFELSVSAFLNKIWQKPKILKLLSTYTGAGVDDQRIGISKDVSFFASDEEKQKSRETKQGEVDEFRKTLALIKTFKADLTQKAKDPKNWGRWSREWNLRLRKEQGDFERTFGKSVPQFKGECQRAFYLISVSLGNLVPLWSEYDAIVEGRKKNREILNLLIEQVNENIQRAEEEILRCAR